MAKKLKDLMELNNLYVIRNSYELIDKLKNIEITNSTRLASFDIVNLYTNVPIKETIHTIK